MRIVGHGIDLIDVERIHSILLRHGDRFLERVFTERESAYAAQSRNRDQHLAGRFAAKEAVLKALGTGLAQGISWTEVEVQLSATGQPHVVLTGRAMDTADALGIREWHLSITHTSTQAIASAIACA